MPRTKISEFSATAADNTDIDSIDIAEGCAPSGINNAIRELMAQLKDFQTGAASDPFNGAVNGTLGATTPAAATITNLAYTGTLTGGTGVINIGSGQVYKDASGNVGIGTASPTNALQLVGTAKASSQLYVGSNSDDNYSGGIQNLSNTSRSISIQADPTNSGASTVLTFGIDGSERMRIDSSGNLGLGVTPSAWGSGWKALQMTAGASFGSHPTVPLAYVNANSYFDGSVNRYIQNSFASRFISDGNSGGFAWQIAPSGTAGNAISFTQAMTLTAANELLLGTTNPSMTVGNGFKFAAAADSICGIVGADSTNNNVTYRLYSTGGNAYRFYVGYGGTVYATSSTISALSDQRLKENIQDIDVGLDAVMALKPRKFDWKAGKGKDKKGDRGWIAQEFEQVFPDMIDTWIDPAPEGEEPYKAVNADLIPVLVKAIQELKAEFDAYKLSHP